MPAAQLWTVWRGECTVGLVSAFTPLSAAQITDPVLVTAAQLTVELDGSLFPMNKKSTQKEPQTWFGALGRQGIPSSLQNTLRRYLSVEHTGARCAPRRRPPVCSGSPPRRWPRSRGR